VSQAVHDAKDETAFPAQKTVGKPDPREAKRLLTFPYYEKGEDSENQRERGQN
jgi:hypothetical protein